MVQTHQISSDWWIYAWLVSVDTILWLAAITYQKSWCVFTVLSLVNMLCDTPKWAWSTSQHTMCGFPPFNTTTTTPPHPNIRYIANPEKCFCSHCDCSGTQSCQNTVQGMASDHRFASVPTYCIPWKGWVFVLYYSILTKSNNSFWLVSCFQK